MGMVLSSNGALQVLVAAGSIEGVSAAKLNDDSFGGWLDPVALELVAIVLGVCDADRRAGNCCSAASGSARTDTETGTGTGTETGTRTGTRKVRRISLDATAGLFFSELSVLNGFIELAWTAGCLNPLRLVLATEALA